MSQDISQNLRKIIDAQLGQSDLDVMEVVPIPMNGDRLARLRTLEEALEDFSARNEATTYLIQVQTKRKEAIAPPAPPAPQPQAAQNIYLPDGKLNVPYLARNAELLILAREHTLARNIYKTIAASGERKGLALFGIGRCDEAEGQLDAARSSYEEAIAYHPHLAVYHRLSDLFQKQQKDAMAADTLERALNLKTVDTRTRFDLHKAAGNCWMRAGEAAKAEAHYRQAQEIDPAADDICANLGALALQTNDVAAARRHFDDALAANPRNARALAGMGSCRLAAGDKQGAHDSFASSLEIELNNPVGIYELIKCAYELRSYERAAKLVEEYVDVAPVNASLLYSLAGLQFHLGRHEDARATARKILGLNAEHGGAQGLLKLIERNTNP